MKRHLFPALASIAAVQALLLLAAGPAPQGAVAPGWANPVEFSTRSAKIRVVTLATGLVTANLFSQGTRPI